MIAAIFSLTLLGAVLGLGLVSPHENSPSKAIR